MKNILKSLTENLQVIYRRSVDADAQLTQLKQKGVGKHGQIFSSESGFEVTSRTFLPYVEELTREIEKLKLLPVDQQAEHLSIVVKKIHLMLTTLDQFKQSLKD